MENYKRRGSLFLLWEMTISRNLCFPALVILSLVSTFPVEQQKKRKSAVSHVEWFWHLPDVYLVFRFSDRIPPIGTETGSRCAYSTVYSPGSRGKSGWNSRFSRPLTEEKVNFVPFFRETKRHPHRLLVMVTCQRKPTGFPGQVIVTSNLWT